MFVYETVSSAARKLGIPEPTLRGLESRGVVPRFQRDAAGRRLITESDLAACRAYLESRRQPSLAPEAA